jgi:predicted membrane GTPase involved in stress response
MISFFKKQVTKPDYSKEIVFQLYTFNSNVLLDYYNAFIKMGAVIESIAGKNDYYSDFDKIVNDIEEKKEGLIISIKDGYAMFMGCNKHKGKELYILIIM